MTTAVILNEVAYVCQLESGDCIGFYDFNPDGSLNAARLWAFQLVSDPVSNVDEDTYTVWGLCLAGSDDIKVGDITIINCGTFFSVWRASVDPMPDLDIDDIVRVSALKSLEEIVDV